MWRTANVLSVLIGFMILVSTIAAEEPKLSEEQTKLVETLQKDLRDRAFKAVKNADFSGDLAVAHPLVIEKRGGKKKLRSQLNTAGYMLIFRGDRLEKIEFPKPAYFVNTEVREYVIIPYDYYFNNKYGRQLIHSFQISVRDNGTTPWKQMNGSGINSDTPVQFYFPDFPKDVELPESKEDIDYFMDHRDD